jgi:hypothetical protein
LLINDPSNPWEVDRASNGIQIKYKKHWNIPKKTKTPKKTETKWVLLFFFSTN